MFPLGKTCSSLSTLKQLLEQCVKRSIIIVKNKRSLFSDQLNDIVGAKNVSNTNSVREQYGKDEGHFSPMLPDYVVWPTTAEQVSKISKLCYKSHVPIIPFGSGTGLEGGVNAMQGGVCISLNKMNEVVEVNQEDFDCTVEAGVTWRDLNRYLADTGLFFPIDPGASASLGGMASTGASGTNAVRYGTMKENVLNMEVVLPNGDLIKTGGIKSRPRKSSAGLNLTELFVGSEGILGTITKITLRLHPIPESSCVCVCHFDEDQTAIDTVIQILQNNIPVSRIEYLDDRSIKASNKYSHGDLEEKPSIFMEMSGCQSSIDSLVKMTEEIVMDNGGKDFKHSSETEERSKLWKARHDLYYACCRADTRPNTRALITDVCVPISKLTEIILKMREFLDEYQLQGSSFGHVGDGNFHSVITYDPKDRTETKNVLLVADKIAEYSIELGGTCTGEHGIGRGKTTSLFKEYDPAALKLMWQIKKVIDPKNLFNPGKVLKC